MKILVPFLCSAFLAVAVAAPTTLLSQFDRKAVQMLLQSRVTITSPIGRVVKAPVREKEDWRTTLRAGLTADPCTSTDECQGDRLCIDEDLQLCTAPPCVCIPPQPIECTSNDVCPTGEVCAILESGNQFCVSEEQVSAPPSTDSPPTNPPPPPPPTDSPPTNPPPPTTDSPPTNPPPDQGGTNPPTSSVPGGGQLPTNPETNGNNNNNGGVCIDARALGHMNKEELVFEEHSMAAVLCDSNESCATPGHIVHFNGKAMMMKTYCEIAGCEKRSMLVNSPRYRKAIRVSSNTEGLEYTAFAARYSTRAEEMFLTSAVHLGF